MRFNPVLLAAVLVVPLWCALPASADTEVRRIERQFEITDNQRVELDLPIAELRVEAGRAGRVEIDIVVSCRSRRCRDRADEVYLDDSQSSRTLELELRGTENRLSSRPSIDVTLRVPESADLDIDLGVGEIEVSGLRGDLSIDLGVGEAKIYGREAEIGTVNLAVGVGDLDLKPELDGQDGSGFLVFGNELYWDEGRGDSDLSVDVGVGELRVRLE